MNCIKVEEHIVDYIAGTLSSTEEALVKTHIAECKTCKQLYDETNELLVSFDNIPKAQPTGNLRDSFYKMLEEEKEKQTKVVPLKPKSNLSWKTAFQIAASVVILLTGYFIGSNREKQVAQSEITNLQFETLKMKQDMMLAMMDNRSPSQRIKAVNFTEEFVKPDTEVLEALIERMQYDANSNVRLAAAEALARFSESEFVRTALMETLTNENDPSVQIEIIQILVTIQEKRALAPMKELLTQPEIPSYVKDQVNIGISKLI